MKKLGIVSSLIVLICFGSAVTVDRIAPNNVSAQIDQPPVIQTGTIPTACSSFLYAYTGTTPWPIYAPNASGACQALAAGSGTVTSVSVTSANGVSGTVATATTTPAISLTLGAITPSSVATSGNVTVGSGDLLLASGGFSTTIAQGTQTGNYIVYMPNSTATDQFAGLADAQTFLALNTFSGGITGGSPRKGTFTCTSGGSILVSNTKYLAASDVVITNNTPGGTVSWAPNIKASTPGTSFTVVCAASDTSVYNYDILN